VKVSVIIPCHNYGRFLGKALDSVIRQTLAVDEIIVVDDGSTDETSQVAAGYGSRVRYIYQENAGASAARNRGAREAAGDWISFLDADDQWEPNKLQIQRGVLGVHPDIEALVCNFWHVTPEGKKIDQGIDRHFRGLKSIVWRQFKDSQVWVVKDRLPQALIEDFMMGLQTLMIRKSTYERMGGLDERFPTGEDLDFFLRLAKQGIRIGFVPIPLVLITQHPHSLCRNNPRTTENLLSVLQAFEGGHNLTEAEAKAVRRQMGWCELGLAWQNFSSGDFEGARSHAVRAIRLGRRWRGTRTWLRTLPILRQL